QRPAENREALDAEPVGQVGHVAGPVEQRPARAPVGAADAGPVRRDDPHAERPRGASAPALSSRQLSPPWQAITGCPPGSPNSAYARRRPSGRRTAWPAWVRFGMAPPTVRPFAPPASKLAQSP